MNFKVLREKVQEKLGNQVEVIKINPLTPFIDENGRTIWSFILAKDEKGLIMNIGFTQDFELDENEQLDFFLSFFKDEPSIVM